MNLASILSGSSSDDVAIIDGSTRVSYGELRDQVARGAAALVDAGLKPNDRVVILGGTEPAFIVSLLAVWHAGMAAVLVNYQEPVPQLTQYLSTLDASAILAGSTQQAMTTGQALADAGIAPMVNLEYSSASPLEIAEVQADTPALFIFTSGVSGLPRAAILTHGNLSATHAGLAKRSETQLSNKSVSLGALPMVHILGLNVAVLSTLRNGGTTVLQNHWSASQALELIAEHGIDTLVMVPAMWSDLANVPDVSPAALEGVKLARCGAATLTPEVATRVKTNLGISLAQGYGLTETAGTITFEPNALSRPGSVGTSLDHVELRVFDSDNDTDAEPGDPGEILVKGDCVFGGYWNEPELNKNLFTDDGWYRTGDVAVFDDGYYLVGRKKDMISVSGFKISPVEVELCLEAHDAISGALVVGEADERTGERVVAYVIPSEGTTVDSEAMQAHVREHLARYKVPKELYVVDNLPANIIGKRIRRDIGK